MDSKGNGAGHLNQYTMWYISTRNNCLRLVINGIVCAYSMLWKSVQLLSWRLSYSYLLLQAKEFGEAEVWMNERLMRAAPGCFAEFLTAFEAEETASKNKGPEPLWLIWQYEGDYTLFDLMQKKDFPYNLELPLLGRELDMPKGPERKAITISLVMQQVGFPGPCFVHMPFV